MTVETRGQPIRINGHVFQPRELGRRVRQELEIRSRARYRPKAEITHDIAEHNLTLAQEMIAHLGAKLGGGDN